MATVAESPPPVQPAAPAPPVRHGTCRLHLQINPSLYTLRPIRHRVGHRRVLGWAVRQVAGPRVGATYAVARYQGHTTCACPDY